MVDGDTNYLMSVYDVNNKLVRITMNKIFTKIGIYKYIIQYAHGYCQNVDRNDYIQNRITVYYWNKEFKYIVFMTKIKVIKNILENKCAL